MVGTTEYKLLKCYEVKRYVLNELCVSKTQNVEILFLSFFSLFPKTITKSIMNKPIS